MADAQASGREDGAPQVAPGSLGELARVFLKLGTIGFGGPAAHIAMMEDEVVVRRGWLTRQAFADLLGAANLIPGPNSTELAIHIGHRRAGRAGLLVAGASFILPAFLLVTALAWVYTEYGALPSTSAVLYGVKPVVVAVILHAVVRLAPVALRTRELAGLGLAALLAALVGAPELLVLFGCGAVAALPAWRRQGLHGAGVVVATGSFAIAAVPFSLLALFLYFVGVGSVLFGSGYLLVALLETTLVEQWAWLTQAQLLDAVAVGLVTPGPVFTTATFIGYLLAGPTGAVVATAGIFAPAFFFVWLSAPLIPRLRSSAPAGAFLDGVTAAAVALIALVALHLGRVALVDPLSWVLFSASLGLVWRRNTSPAWLVIGGAVVGLTSGLLGGIK